MKLIFIRHGESEGNKHHKIYGWTDYPLTEKGLKQVDVITAYMANQSFHKLFSSPLLRTKYIAEQILCAFKKLNLDQTSNNSLIIFEDSRIKEMNCGIFEGLTEEEVLVKYNDEYNQYLANFETYSIPNGESFNAFKARIIAFLENNLPKENETYVYVTHGGVIRELMTYLLKLEPGKVWDYSIYPGCIVELEYKEGCWQLINILQT